MLNQELELSLNMALDVYKRQVMAFSITYAANRLPESVVIGMDLAFFIAITQAAVNMRFIADEMCIRDSINVAGTT